MEIKRMALADVTTPQVGGAFLFTDTSDNDLLKLVQNIGGNRVVNTVAFV